MKIIIRSLIVWLGIGVLSHSGFASERPNVLFIAVDDLRDWVGHLDGNPQVKTPNLDRLAKRGVSFRRAYCAAPLCNPSRISLLTGVAPANSGVYGNGEKLRGKMPEAITLMQCFRAAGYGVRGCGKIFHGTNAYDQKSWDEYFVPTRSRTKANPQRDMNLPETAWTPWGNVDLRDDEMFDGKVASWAISEIQKPRREPFFLACGFTKPHLPWIVPRKYFNLYPLDTIKLPPSVVDDLSDVPSFGRRLAREVYDPSGEKNFAAHGGDHENIRVNGQWHTAVQAYLATISFVDAQIGRVLEALDNSQYVDNTIIVLWGDHGWHLGEHAIWGKHALFEESLRSPLIIQYKGLKNPGQRTDSIVESLDVFPTLCDLSGLPTPTEAMGVSLKQCIEDVSAIGHPAISYARKGRTIRTDRYRLIVHNKGNVELYDHSTEQAETENVAAQKPGIVAELKQLLEQRRP